MRKHYDKTYSTALIPQNSIGLSQACNLVLQVDFHLKTAKCLMTIELLSCGDLTDDSLAQLNSLSRLESITLKGAYNVTSRALRAMQNLAGLTFLNLSGALNLDTASLEGFCSLIYLDLSSCSALTAIAFSESLPLKGLNLQGCPKLSDNAVTSLKSLRHLESANLNGLDITNTTMSKLHFKPLRVEHLNLKMGR